MPLPLTSPGRWIRDSRGEGRAVRVSAHAEAGFLVLSTWKAGACVGTVHLLPEEAAELVAGLADGLAELARPEVVSQPVSEPEPERGSVLRLLPGR